MPPPINVGFIAAHRAVDQRQGAKEIFYPSAVEAGDSVTAHRAVGYCQCALVLDTATICGRYPSMSEQLFR